MTVRQQIAEMLKQPRTMSSIAHELKLTRDEVEDHVKHLVRSARAADHDIRVEPARCRSCGYTFGQDYQAGEVPRVQGHAALRAVDTDQIIWKCGNLHISKSQRLPLSSHSSRTGGTSGAASRKC